jgi:hypothetical protein
VGGSQLMGHHLLDAVLGLDGFGCINSKCHAPDAFISQLETVHAGRSSDIVGPLDGVDEVAAAALDPVI